MRTNSCGRSPAVCSTLKRAKRFCWTSPKRPRAWTAVLCPMERFDRARFFALLADSKGFDVEAFTSYEEAMSWLSGDEA